MGTGVAAVTLTPITAAKINLKLETVVNADVEAAAAIAFSKLAALPSGNIIVGSAGNVPTAVAMGGDATIIAAGTLTIGAGKIDNAKIKPNDVDGTVAANVADANVIGGIPVVHRISIADVGAPTNTDVILTHKTKIIDMWVIKAGNNGGVGDTVKLVNVASGNDITNALDIGVNDKVRVGVSTIDDAEDTILPAGTLRVTAVKATHCDCTVFVLGARSA